MMKPRVSCPFMEKTKQKEKGESKTKTRTTKETGKLKNTSNSCSETTSVQSINKTSTLYMANHK